MIIREARLEDASRIARVVVDTWLTTYRGLIPDVKIAKEIGLNPRSLIKNIPNKSEQWKAPVSIWIHEMYQKRQEMARRKKARKEKTTE